MQLFIKQGKRNLLHCVSKFSYNHLYSYSVFNYSLSCWNQKWFALVAIIEPSWSAYLCSLICLCQFYRASPVCTFMQSDKAALYCWLVNFKFSSWYVSKLLIMESSKNYRWTSPFMKFSRWRVKCKRNSFAVL